MSEKDKIRVSSGSKEGHSILNKVTQTERRIHALNTVKNHTFIVLYLVERFFSSFDRDQCF